MTPTRNGDTITPAGAALTPEQARALADLLEGMADAIDRERRIAEHRPEGRAVRAAIEAAHPGGRWHSSPWGEGYTVLEDGRPTLHTERHLPMRGRWEDLPPMPERRIRLRGGIVAHVWRGGGRCLCGAPTGKAELAPKDLRICTACARRLDE